MTCGSHMRRQALLIRLSGSKRTAQPHLFAIGGLLFEVGVGNGQEHLKRLLCPAQTILILQGGHHKACLGYCGP